jgi:hypothetical protein
MKIKINFLVRKKPIEFLPQNVVIKRKLFIAETSNNNDYKKSQKLK